MSWEQRNEEFRYSAAGCCLGAGGWVVGLSSLLVVGARIIGVNRVTLYAYVPDTMLKNIVKKAWEFTPGLALHRPGLRSRTDKFLMVVSTRVLALT